MLSPPGCPGGLSYFMRGVAQGATHGETGPPRCGPERSGMELQGTDLQSLMDQWESMGEFEWHTATQPGGDAESGWTVEWVLRGVFARIHVAASYQEECAL